MGTADIIKSYLVELGFQVDNQGFNKFNKALQDASNAVQSHTAGWAGAYIKAATMIVGAITTITGATVALIDKTAQLDLGYQKLALHMYMAVDQAKQYKIVTDAMGEKIDDIAWIPELRQRYMSLMDQTKQMELPGDAEGQMKHIRDVRFEFTRLKVEMTYGLQWIGYELMKNLGIPINNVYQWMKNFNDWITSHMAEWTSKIANFLAPVVKVFIWLINEAKKLWEVLSDIWEQLKSVGVPDGIGELIKAFMKLTSSVVNMIVQFAKIPLVKEFFKAIAEGGMLAINIFTAMLNLLTHLFDAVTAAISGRIPTAVGILKNAAKQFASEIMDSFTGKPVKSGPAGGGGARTGSIVGDNSDIRALANQVGSQLGIPGDLIYAQWSHESTGFTSQLARENYNLAGLTQTTPNGEDNKQPDGTNYYKQYGSYAEFANDYVDFIRRNDPHAIGSQTPEELAHNLKTDSYYTADEDAYSAGIRSNYPTESGLSTAAQNFNGWTGNGYTPQGSSSGSVQTNIGTMNIMVPPGTKDPSGFTSEVMRQMNEQMGVSNARQMRDFSGIR